MDKEIIAFFEIEIKYVEEPSGVKVLDTINIVPTALFVAAVKIFGNRVKIERTLFDAQKKGSAAKMCSVNFVSSVTLVSECIDK